VGSADSILESPAGGNLLITNLAFVRNKDVLVKHGVTAIVNSTSNLPNFHEGNDQFKYLAFDVARFSKDADKLTFSCLD
jgi:hypothetical protein